MSILAPNIGRGVCTPIVQKDSLFSLKASHLFLLFLLADFYVGKANFPF